MNRRLILASLLAPLVFWFLASCNFTAVVKVTIDCPLPIPIVTDTTLTGMFNGLCPYYVFEGDTLRLVEPGKIG